MRSRALGLLLGFIADRIFGDPRRFHPVAGFGRLAETVEQRLYADDRMHGVVYSGLLLGSTGALGLAADRLAARRPFLHMTLTATTTWAVLGGRSLGREADAVHAHLVAGDLPAARRQLTHLVGRDTSQLDESDVSRATIESVAENTSDAVVAPLVAGAFGGIGGLVAYRAANTLDAMVGHRNARYANFGWASARLDDVANLPGARLCAVLATVLAPTIDGRSANAWRAWRRDAKHHPSPNAGPVEASFAGAMDVTLGGVNRYGERIEDRHTLGDGPPATPKDITRSVKLARNVGIGATAAAVVIASGTSRRRH
ncbi:MAG: cobalamin biosynthesis protein [Aeromicrobium sp.]